MRMRNMLILQKMTLPVCLLGVLLLIPGAASAAEDWEFAVEGYGWLPNIDIQEEGGQSTEITLDDIIDNLDIAAMIAGQARKGKWSFSTDIIYLDLSNKPDAALSPLLSLKKLEIESWIVTPTLGYTVYQSGQNYIDLYAGARYLWLDVKTTLELNLPGSFLPTLGKGIDESGSNWDAIVGVRVDYHLSDKWHLPYSVNGGAGQSDFTFQATRLTPTSSIVSMQWWAGDT